MKQRGDTPGVSVEAERGALCLPHSFPLVLRLYCIFSITSELLLFATRRVVVVRAEMLLCVCQIVRVRSSELLEADVAGLFSEASSADQKLVLSDQAFLVGAHSAVVGILAVFPGVRVKLMRHILMNMER